MYNFKRLVSQEARCFCDHIAVMKGSTIIYYAVYDLKKPLIKIQDKNKMMLINNPENENDPCRNRIGTMERNRFIINPEYTGTIKFSDDILYYTRF